jgi:hypothetical protein
MPEPNRIAVAVSRARTGLRGAWSTTRELAAAEPLRNRRLWLALTFVLVVGPVAITLSRSSSFEASVEMFATNTNPIAKLRSSAYFDTLLARQQIQIASVDQAGNGLSELDVSVEPSERLRRPTFILTARAETPARVVAETNAVAAQLASASGQQLEAAAERRIRQGRRELRSDKTDPLRKRALREQRDALRKLLNKPHPRVVLGTAPAEPPLTSWADKLIDKLPGAYPPRPSPVWVGLAGLLLSIALGLGWLYRPRGSRGPRGPGRSSGPGSGSQRASGGSSGT